MKKTLISIITATTLMTGSMAYASGNFSDVSENDWFYDSVNSAYELGIITGNGDGTFAPEGQLTVAEAITLASRINASHFQKELSASAESGHWSEPFFEYAIDNGIIEEGKFQTDDYDRAIKRGEMFDVFANVLPEDEYPVVNNMLDIPQTTDDEAVKKLFCSGIVIGSDSGFEADKNITRAETAAICVRIADKDKRIKVGNNNLNENSEPETETEITEPVPSGTEGADGESEGEVVESQIYSIPLTFWDEGDNVTGAPKIMTGEVNGIKTRFGNHVYGTEKQTQYEYVMEALDEAYEHTAGDESKLVKDPNSTYNLYRAGRITQEKVEKLFKDRLRDDKMHKALFDENLAIKDDTVYSNFCRAYQTAEAMMDYLIEEYVDVHKKSDVGGSDGINDNTYLYLAKRGSLDYEGWANMHMAIYDYLGFSTRAVETIEGKCRGVQILLCGEWVCVELMSKDMCLINATSDQLKLYAESNGKEGKGEKAYLKGRDDDGAVTDLKVVIPATHLPDNFDYDAK